MRNKSNTKVAFLVVLIFTLAGLFSLQRWWTGETSNVSETANPIFRQKPKVDLSKVNGKAACIAAADVVTLPEDIGKEVSNATFNNDNQAIDGAEELITSLLLQDDLASKRAVSGVLDAIRAELGKIETMQGTVVVTIDNDPPIVNGDFYISRRDGDGSQMMPMPFQYTVKIRDDEKGFNLFTTDSQKIKPRVWFDNEADGSESQSQPLPPILTRQLSGSLLAPIIAMLGAYEETSRTKEGFLRNDVFTAHKSCPEEEQGREGGPFWIVQTIGQGTFWLSEGNRLSRLVKTRNGNELDISYNNYELIDGVRYPTDISLRLATDNPGGQQYIKAFTGKDAKQAEIKVLLRNMKINKLIPKTVFVDN